MNISIEKTVEYLSAWNCFGSMMLLEYKFGDTVFTREDGSFIPREQNSWSGVKAITEYEPLDTVDEQMKTLDKLLTKYVMPSSDFVFHRLLDMVLILQGWSGHAEWGDISILKAQKKDTWYAPQMDRNVRDAILEVYTTFVPEYFSGKGKKQPEELSTKEWLEDCTRVLRELIDRKPKIRNKQLQVMMRNGLNAQGRDSLWRICVSICNTLKNHFVDFSKETERPSWPRPKEWGNEVNWQVYLVHPPSKIEPQTVASKAFWRLPGMGNFLDESTSPENAAKEVKLMGMCHYFPKHLVLATINSMLENWVTTSHAPETTVVKESDTWYTIWLEKLKNRNFANFEVEDENENQVARAIEAYARQDSRFTPQKNSVANVVSKLVGGKSFEQFSEESPVLNQAGLKPEEETRASTWNWGFSKDDQRPTSGRRGSFEGITTETTYQIGPVLAAGGILAGVYYLVS